MIHPPSTLGMAGPIPVHPQPGFYETTIAIATDPLTGEEVLVDRHIVEEIRDQPPWNFADAEARVMAERRAERNGLVALGKHSQKPKP